MVIEKVKVPLKIHDIAFFVVIGKKRKENFNKDGLCGKKMY